MLTYSTKKYLLYPEWVTSKNDGDWHYIGAAKLAALYHVDLHECVVIYDWEDKKNLGCEDLIKLFVRWDGNYTLPENKP